jgi:colicin import membrane protein
MPRSPDGTAPGLALSVLAHGALLAALAYGVSWRSPAPETISAELWAAVPQSAAPPAAEQAPPPAPAPTPAPPPKPEPVAKVAPPPPVPDPQIAIEKARKEKLEKARLEREEQARQDKLAREKLARDKAEREKQDRERQKLAQEKEAAAQRQQAAEKAAEDARQAKIREDNLRRMMGQLGNSSSASAAQGTRGTAAVTAAPSASYGGRLIGAIKPNIVFTEDVAGNPAAVVEVRATATGTIVGRTLVKSSGVKEWDEAVLRAIDRTGKLPPDTDGRVPSTLSITFRPRD